MKKILLVTICILLSCLRTGGGSNLSATAPIILEQPCLDVIYVTTTSRIDDLELLHPYFNSRVELFLDSLKKRGIEILIVETYRIPERQDYLKRKGKTGLSGGDSKHQYGLAIDIVPWGKNRTLKWHDRKLWYKIGRVGEHFGLTWGGRFKKLYDPGHFEWDGECTIEQLKEGDMPLTGCTEAQAKRLKQEQKKYQNI